MHGRQALAAPGDRIQLPKEIEKVMATTKTAAKKGGAKRAAAQRLKGMEDMGIPELDRLANDYADVRDRRIALSRQEGDMKKAILGAMHKHHREQYVYDGVTIRVVAGDEDVKVKIRAADVEIDEE
jgi:hypothetical protein